MVVLIFILTLSVLVLVHEFGHFLMAKKMGVKVEEFGIGLPPKLFGIRKGETLYTVNLLPIGGFVKLFGEEYSETTKGEKHRTFVDKKPWQKTLIVLGGVFGNFLLGWFIFSYLVTQGVPVPTNQVIVETVTKNSPASRAGLQTKDIITNFTTSDQLIAYTKKFAGKEIKLQVVRNQKKLVLNLVPRLNPPKGQGPLGIAITSYTEKKYPWYTAPYYGLVEAFNISSKIASELGKMLLGFITFQKQKVDVAGPIGIASLAGQAVKFGKNAYLEFLALLSLNLAIMNILPFPALDGGRLVFVLYEGFTKKKPNKHFEQYTNIIGFVALLSLAALITVNDIAKLFRK